MMEMFLTPEPAGSWVDRALCATEDPEAFLATAATGVVTTCLRCPVMKECGDDATAHGERHGVWGGLDRRRLN